MINDYDLSLALKNAREAGEASENARLLGLLESYKAQLEAQALALSEGGLRPLEGALVELGVLRLLREAFKR
jgi:hypothetical protein